MSAVTIPFDGGVVRVVDDERLAVLDRAADEIWLALDDGWAPRDLAETLASKQKLDVELVHREISSIAEARARPPTAGPLRSTTPAPLAETRWRCRIRGRTIGFAVDDPARARSLRSLLQHLETPGADPQLGIEVRDLGGGRSLVAVDGRPRAEIEGEIGLRDTVHAAIAEFLWPERPIMALVHGGAVALDGRVLCLPAFAGSGKTTLIAYLATRGFRYLADDMTIVDQLGCVLPWPMPLNIKEGSWSALRASYPQLAAGPHLHTTKGRSTLALISEEAWNVSPARLNMLLFPRFTPGASVRVEPLRPFEALQHLAEAGIWLGHPLTGERVSAFLKHLEQVPAYALTYDRLEDAEAAIRAALHE